MLFIRKQSLNACGFDGFGDDDADDVVFEHTGVHGI